MSEPVTYEEALAEARRNAERFPSGTDESGMTWIEVEGRKYPKEWFIKHCARMKASGEI